MLSYVDRIQLVVPDRKQAAARWKAVFGAEQVSEDGSRFLNAHRTTVQAGRSLFEFLEPAGPGPVQDFRDRWGQGLYGAGFSTPDLGALARRIADKGEATVDEKGCLYLAETRFGMPTVLVQDEPRDYVGHIRCIYEVTNPVTDWEAATDYYTGLFGLDASRYCPIGSRLYGYKGTLTLFEPPARLDRVEVVTTYEGSGAMDRFYRKRGDSLYMCYIETDDVDALAARLEANDLRYAPGEGRPDGTNIFIHPQALFGMLMGVSKTMYGWAWSGHPELAGAPVGDGTH
jgi:catechol 2,3-dioxygenase-like lactoylglutathione lyase family enzyme